MKLMVGIPTQEFARQAVFYDYLALLDIPKDTLIMKPHGQSPARGRNLIIEQALLNECTHILFIDDDTAFPPDLFTKLVRWDVDMVTGIYCMRNFPHKPIIFDIADEEGRCLYRELPDDLPNDELIPLVAAGLGACLIQTSVFEKMERPWITLGELEKDHWCDDISFFRRAIDAGFNLWGDPSVLVGHMATVTIYPQRDAEGRWQIAYDTAGTMRVNFPMQRTQVEAPKDEPTPV